jgi:hypothetical protein
MHKMFKLVAVSGSFLQSSLQIVKFVYVTQKFFNILKVRPLTSQASLCNTQHAADVSTRMSQVTDTHFQIIKRCLLQG